MVAARRRRKVDSIGQSLELERAIAVNTVRSVFNKTHGIVDPGDPSTLIYTPKEVDSFTLFKYKITKNYQHAPHLEALDQLLMSITKFIETGGAEGISRALISFPPRHGKSTTISRAYPPWHLGRNPDNRIILSSYGFTLAKKHSRAARNTVGSDVYNTIFPTVRVSKESRAVDAWNIQDHEGGLDAVGVGGGITGKGGNVIIVDDAVKNRKQAESPSNRENIWDWFTDDLYTRLEPGGVLIVVGTRWHTDDLIGRIKIDDPNGWTDLCLPAIAHLDDQLGREPGEALWPQRYPVTVLNVIKQKLGTYSWSSLYDQDPVPAEGGLFKREWFAAATFRVPLDYVRNTVGIAELVIALDPAVTATEHSDEIGIIVMAKGEDGHGYVLGDFTLSGTPGEWSAKVVELYYQWQADWVLGETNHGGDLIGDTVRTADKERQRELGRQGVRYSTLAFKSIKASKGKFTRATPVAALYEQGLIHHTEYFTDLETQMLTWNQGQADSPDRLDALVWGASYLLIPEEDEVEVIISQGSVLGRGGSNYDSE